MVTNTRAQLAANHRHSLDAKQGSPAPVRRDVAGLRQEQSSPAVVQPAGDCSLLKAVVSASGQGAPALLHAAGNNSNKAIWRSRSVRNKLESYAILQLKGKSNRDVTVQVTFQSPGTTPQQLRLLHAPAVNCASRSRCV
ncbi:hypothetical protein OEZ86_006170 [Tetradesmus obliquus]|nr:hypothetical protein OEZ86_006170 [Tetradesmus obliquus]